MSSLDRLKQKWPFPTRNIITVNRWFSLIVGLLMMVCSGTQYMFGSLSPKIKKAMDYDQTQINLVGTFANVGSYAGIGPSVIHDMFGARPNSILSGSLIFVGYFLSFLMLCKAIPSNYILLAICFGIMGNGSSGCYVTAISTNIKNFSAEHRGKLVGLHSACFGISSAIFTLVFRYIFKEKLTPFIMFLALFGGCIPLVLGTIFMNVISEQRKKTDGELIEEEGENTLAPIATEQDSLLGGNHLDAQYKNELDQQALLEQTEEIEKSFSISTDKTEAAAVAAVLAPPDNDVNAIQMICTLDFWLFCFCYFAGAGAGLTIVNNLGSVVISYGGKDGDQDILVLFYSIGNCLGRIVFGYLSDRFSWMAQRTTFFVFGVLMIGVASYSFIFAPLKLFLPLIIFTGFMYGCILVSSPAFVSERFGAKFFAVNSTVCSVSPALASYIISTLLAGKVYQNHIKGSGKECHGRACFGVTFMINTGLCTLAFMVGLVLMYKNRRLYAEKERYKQSLQKTK